MVRTYLIAFDSADHARVFVKRLHLAFDRRKKGDTARFRGVWPALGYSSDVASFRDDCHVLVFDASTNGATRRIAELARSSSATAIREH